MRLVVALPALAIALASSTLRAAHAAWPSSAWEPDPRARIGAPEDGQPSEYRLKAAVLYKFARYTHWPESAFKDKNAPFVVAVVGKDPFGALLDDTFLDHTIGDRKVQIVRWSDAAQIDTCHLLFVAGADEKLEERVCEKVRGRSVLTITDSLRGAERSAHIGFYLENSKVRFGVNVKNAKACSLEISSELLKVSKIIAGAAER